MINLFLNDNINSNLNFINSKQLLILFVLQSLSISGCNSDYAVNANFFFVTQRINI